MRADWAGFIADLRHRVQFEGPITVSVDEIVARTRLRNQSIRTQGFWSKPTWQHGL